jgi:eukaryotic-like serine/threonine-protein kinase
VHKPGDIIDERYLLVKLLGLRGGAEIWEAEHEVVGRKVTLKLFSGDVASDPAVQARLAAESRAAAEIGHPAAVEVFDVGATAAGEAYLVAEPLRGETLRDLVGRRGRLRAPDACHLAREILAGLAAAHQAGIVHGALGPDAVVLRRDPGDRVVLKILDFVLVPSPEMRSELAEVGTAHMHPTSVTERAAPRIGSDPPGDAAMYLAPEQALGESEDPRSDLYAVGAMLFEMLTGQAPLRPERETMAQASVPEALLWIVERAMANAPSLRFASAQEMADALAPFAAKEASLAMALRDSMMPLLSGEARRSRGMARLERAVLGPAPSGRANLVVIDGARASARGPEPEEKAPEIPRPPRTPNLREVVRPFESGHPLRRGYARRARMARWLRPMVRRGRAPARAFERWLVPALFVLALCAGVLIARFLRM